MKVNNYNTNSSGIDISVSCFYDTFLAQDNFNMLLVPTEKKDRYKQTVYKLEYMKERTPYRIIGLRGYSQGDYISVMVPARMSDYSDYIKHIKNVIYDAPLYINVKINNEEYFTFDLLEDEYICWDEFTKTKVINEILSQTKEDSKEVAKYLYDLLPDEADYRY